MKIISFFRNTVINNHLLICIIVLVQMYGCYSFTGGSIPEHLKTLYLSSVNDNSGYGDPRYRENLYQLLIDKFKNDNSFNLVQQSADARLNVQISSIRDETLTVRPGELETERKATVSCEVEYYDAVKKIQIFKKSFSAYNVYSLANSQTERNLAITKALDQISDDIMLAVVSGW
ncbi:MAG: LPS assembly lipoprotein LptE [Bacteroidota bacterium]